MHAEKKAKVAVAKEEKADKPVKNETHEQKKAEQKTPEKIIENRTETPAISVNASEHKPKNFEKKSGYAPREERNFAVMQAPKITVPVRKNLFPENKVFNKWSLNEVRINDLGLANYLCLDSIILPHSFGRKISGRLGKSKINIVERLVNKVMRSGQGKRKLSGKFIRGRGSCGKKLQAMEIVEDAFTIVEMKTGKNPIQVLVTAIENAAPREDVTRIKRGGVPYSIAVDVSPQIRLDESLKNIALAGFANSFNKKTSAAEALAEEMIAASTNDSKSSAVKRRDEVERIAKASR
ncbi:MAG: 30S ribosomal protein S7 [Candidatus Izemoplasmatales bacterium]|jgi:small subunit ribosomal protein S7